MAAWQEVLESLAYANGDPYPRFAFGSAQWPADKGPRPTPLPYAKILIEEGAEFLFRGGPPQFTVGDDSKAEGFLAALLRRNKVAARYIPLAVHLGNQGTIAAKFAFLPGHPQGPVRFSFLSVPQECRVWVDPHDREQVLMARIQYPYRSAADGNWYFFREEWTADFHVSYAPKLAGDASVQSPMLLSGYLDTLGDAGDWQIEDEKPNPFGLVPVTLIRNKQVEGSPLGAGDCWGLFRLMDRIALTMHGEDRSNQMHSDPTTVAINAELESGALAVGETLSVRNTNPDGPAADLKLLEPTGAARQFSHMTIDKWEDLLYKSAGLSRVDPATIGNKGNLTRLALMTAYARTIATSDRKRISWGQGGLAVFLGNVLLALNRMGGVPECRNVTEDTLVETSWGDYFDPTSTDISEVSVRTIDQAKAGLLPKPRAAERLALAEGVPASEINGLKAEIENAPDPIENAPDPKPPREPLADNGANEDGPGEAGADTQGEFDDVNGANSFTS